MGAFLRQFNSSLQTSDQPSDGASGNSASAPDDRGLIAAGPQSTGAGNTLAQAGNKPAKTDNSGLRTGPTVMVWDPDGNDESFEEPDVEYDFAIDIYNKGKLPTGPFFVRFEISDLNWHEDVPYEDGLDADGHDTPAVHYGKIPLDTDVTLSACIYSTSNPGKPIVCAGTANIMVKKWH